MEKGYWTGIILGICFCGLLAIIIVIENNRYKNRIEKIKSEIPENSMEKLKNSQYHNYESNNNFIVGTSYIYNVIDEIMKNKDKIEFVGIMSLGKIGDKKEFEKMVEIKNEICEKYSLDKNKFIASFGTSQDFNEAILSGTDEVRIGHQIFEVD